MEDTLFDTLGIHLNAMTKYELLEAVEEAESNGKPILVANHNLHSLYLWFRNARMRKFYSLADYTHIDGMSVVAISRLLGGPFRPEHRTGYVDLLPVLAGKAAQRGWKIFYLGSKPGVAERAACRLRADYPDLEIRTHDGYFDTRTDSEANRNVLEEIRDYHPHILMVGMGMPRQEIWVLENRSRISAQAIFCCGALMDYVAGEIPTPPRWLGPLGLEWLYRLLSEPTRLWRRYLLEPWFVFTQLAGQYLRLAVLGSGSKVDGNV